MMNHKMLLLTTFVLILSGCQTLHPNQATVPNGVYSEQTTNLNPADRRETFYFTHDFHNARTYGKDDYRYRMVLLYPASDNDIMPNQPYALSHNDVDLPFVKDEKKVFQGVTDRYGRTDVFAFEQPVNPKGWNLRPRTGKGKYGEQYVLTDQNDQPIQAFSYVLVVCGKKPHQYQGITDKLGQTAYVATPTVQNIILQEDSDGELLSKKEMWELCQNPP